MGSSINKIILVGKLGKDPINRTTDSGIVSTLTITTTEHATNKQRKQPQERTEWHRVVLWNRLAEIAKNYLRKGNQVYIEGKLQTRKWKDGNGKDCYITEIIAREIQILGGKHKNASTPDDPKKQTDTTL